MLFVLQVWTFFSFRISRQHGLPLCQSEAGMSGSISDIQEEIVGEFAFFEDWTDKYRYIIDLGKELAPYPEAERTEDNKVRGCQSQVWLHASNREGKLFFEGDSDAHIVKGLVALLLRTYSGHSPKEILDTPLTFIDEIGLSSHLSPTRSNGLAAMVKQIKAYALAYGKLMEG